MRLNARGKRQNKHKTISAVIGADLLAAGVPEGKALGEALRYAHVLHLSGVPKEEALPRAVERAGQ